MLGMRELEVVFIIPAQGRLKQENGEFQASLSYSRILFQK